MQLQEWYDDDKEDYDEYELKARSKKNATLYRRQMCSQKYRSQTAKRNNSKMSHRQNGWIDHDQVENKDDSRHHMLRKDTQKARLDKIYVATPAAITLQMLLTLAQLHHHSVTSAFLNTPFQP
eukprot:429647-Amphidinium_carterae.2